VRPVSANVAFQCVMTVTIDDSRNDSRRLIGRFAQDDSRKTGMIRAHWWWWFAQARFFVVAPCRELHLATKYTWDDVFSAYIALKCSVTDNWHEWVVCDRDSKPCGVLWFTRWPVNITVKPTVVYEAYCYTAWIEYRPITARRCLAFNFKWLCCTTRLRCAR